MDIRGVEITNQLRSAIRAKLLELGVRYDDELPDYILVMVVNKKSRLQMNEDLHLFLEDSTEPFVNWLHDQVLKKLQKVTIAKKKTNKEVPTAIVKQEDEEKKIKEEDQPQSTLDVKPEIITKQDRDREFEELVGDLALLNEADTKESLNTPEIIENKSRSRKNSVNSIDFETDEIILEKKDSMPTTPNIISREKSVSPPKLLNNEILSDTVSNISDQNLKRTLQAEDIPSEKYSPSAKRSKISHSSDDEDDHRSKLSTNKPRITSVVSVKTRLGVISPTKKLDSQIKSSNDVRNTSNKNHLDIRRSEITSQRSSFSESKSTDKRKRSEDSKTEKSRMDRSEISLKNDKSNRIEDSREKGRLSNKPSDIKSRLGISNAHKDSVIDKPAALKSASSIKISKPRISNVKSRLGIRIKSQNKLSGIASRLSQKTQKDKSFHEEDDDAESVINTSLKSHIIAIQKTKPLKPKQRSTQVALRKLDLKKELKKVDNNEDKSEDDDDCKILSKVIVTPRPLKPLQPSQKRATQSLLLKAVAEANQSVVMQKKIDPCLKEQKQKPSNKIKIVRDPLEGKILSVNLNSKKRVFMEKIQVELNNPEKLKYSKAHSSKAMTDEHMNVVKSLFKRSDDKQKFLVTLNGYNNNILREKNSDDEEGLEMEVNEDDELTLDNNQIYEQYIENDQIIDDNDQYIDENHKQYEHESQNKYIHEDHDQYTNDDHVQYISSEQYNYTKQKVGRNENSNAENLRHEENSSKKRRKLSPIVYTRSRSNSPENKPTLASTVSSVLRIDKRPSISSVITTVADKSSEKCRYWPNCTLGIKCAYFHPEVLCSSFPACKFGEKCAYKHPKCKFGSTCTKVGCIFSHPPVQCKYHPYCMKPGCPFSHPKTSSSSALTAPLTPDISTVRAKFTWKKKE